MPFVNDVGDVDPVPPEQVLDILLIPHLMRQAFIDRLENLGNQLSTVRPSQQGLLSDLFLVKGSDQGVVFPLFSGDLAVRLVTVLGRLDNRFVLDRPGHTTSRDHVDSHHRQCQRRGKHRPGLLLSDQPSCLDFAGQQRCVNPGHVQRLQRQAQWHRECQYVVLEFVRVEHLLADDRLQRFGSFDVVLQTLLQELLQSGQLETVATTQHPHNLRIAVDAREIADRPLNLRDVLVEHRPQCLEDRPRILGLRRVALEMFGLGERQLHLLGQRPREVVASKRNIANPDLRAVGDQQRRVVGSHVEHDRVLVVVGRLLVHPNAHLVVTDEIVQGQRSDLDEIDFESRVEKRLQSLEHLLTFHREQADLGIEHVAAVFVDTSGDLLEVPDDIVEIKRDLLLRLVLDNLGDFVRFDRRQVDEPRQGGGARQANRHPRPVHVVILDEPLDRLRNQLLGNRVGLAENLGGIRIAVLDVRVAHGQHLVGRFGVTQLHRLKAGLANVNSPYVLAVGHVRLTPTI